MTVFILLELNAHAQLNLSVRHRVKFAKSRPYNAVHFKSRTATHFTLTVNLQITPALNLQIVVLFHSYFQYGRNAATIFRTRCKLGTYKFK